MDNPDASVSELMQAVKGPDFPTGGIVQGVDGIRKAYETGKGKVVVRGRAAVEDVRGNRQQIVIDEIPYDVNKATMVKKWTSSGLTGKWKELRKSVTKQTGLVCGL